MSEERQLVTMRTLLANGVHYGHRTRNWDPKAKPFIYTSKNGIYIIDLNKTLDSLQVAYDELKKIAENGGKVLFVGTKKNAQQIVLNEATRSGSFYINQRWLGGTLTNFKTIQKRIKRLLEIQEMENSGTINVYPKKEQAQYRKEAARLENFLGGIKDMKKLPDAVVVVEPKEDHNAVREARKLGIPVFGIVCTNCDPAFVDWPIPGNDVATRSIELILSILADAIVESKEGILRFAYQQIDEEEGDISMEDVIINVNKTFAEREKQRRQKNEERNRNNQNKRPSRFNSEKRFYTSKNNEGEEKEDAKEEVIIEDVAKDKKEETVTSVDVELVKAHFDKLTDRQKEIASLQYGLDGNEPMDADAIAEKLDTAKGQITRVQGNIVKKILEEVKEGE